MRKMFDVSFSRTIKNMMWNILCWMNSSKEIRKGKEMLPTFQLITPRPIKGYNPNILNEEPYLVMFMGTKLPRLGYNGCM